MDPTEVPETPVRAPTGGVVLNGDLSIPSGARGIVLFAHGSGSSRLSSRNRFVARELQRNGLATLLIDLLTPEEEAADLRTAQYRFDIGLLGRRLVGLVDWLAENPQTKALRIGLFGASTGAAGALIAAAERPEAVRAVVSRGGRPDLAAHVLDRVRAPTLLIVGSADLPVLRLNEEALQRLRCEKRLAVVPGAGHLFEEPGALAEVARLAAEWFKRYLVAS
ncbi:MAG: dienelactone hydrolase family protein [Armatimonadetes bacterium]|nr:dienelactone hydrolase family protein [Armatimonadota bacterium]MDW8154485.1 dienelactone hydrolase family protein [Armatimonadota bacterium]